MKKLISILGSTGSIGQSSCKIIDKRKNHFNFYLLSANKNYDLICKQIKKYKPKFFIINDQKIYKKIYKKFKNKKVQILNSYDLPNLKKISDITISAIPGLAGLKPTILFTKKSRKILIANKESIICGWELIKKAATKNKTNIIPIDSEHFSILNLLENHSLDEIKKIYITASGGPFLNLKKKHLKKIKPSDALKHPKWKMGKKISIDSSTLMNKILELIEAQKLFNIPDNKIDILIHPDSLVHAIIEFKNGLVKLMYHDTSMIIPLANAIFEKKVNIDLFYKNKKEKFADKIIKGLQFRKVRKDIFPLIKLKKKVQKYSSAPIIVNAANEILVDRFLNKKLEFLRINKIIMSVLNDRNYKKYAIRKPKNINRIIEIDEWARETAKKYVL
tara:strand:+ start:9115 stop:10284 length:1170 start_codon:yes stop_codon:yes gene_type:complete